MAKRKMPILFAQLLKEMKVDLVANVAVAKHLIAKRGESMTLILNGLKRAHIHNKFHRIFKKQPVYEAVCEHAPTLVPMFATTYQSRLLLNSLQTVHALINFIEQAELSDEEVNNYSSVKQIVIGIT